MSEVRLGRTLGVGIIRAQIKTRDRVRGLAEVYTHEREVNAMLDLLGDMFPSEDDPGNHDRTFLEPTCGSGNFLEEILRRKLSTVTVRRYGRGERYEHRVLRCLASIYGIDIDPENVIEARDRLRAVVASHLDLDLNTQSPTVGLATAIEAILETNVICENSLLGGPRIRLVHYRPGKVGYFVREWSSLEASNPGQARLFNGSAVEPLHDAEPIHYSQLATKPDLLAAAKRL